MKYTLSEEFLEKYKDKQPNWGVLGFITYKRTYARRVENENRTENWWETIRRVVEGNYNLPVNDPRPHHEIIKEMELTYDLMFNFAFIAPGRGLWISGTDIGMKNGSALVNCWNIACKPICYIEGKAKKVSMPFCFSFDQAMLGGGIGFNVMKQNVNKIPTVKNIVDLTIVCDYDHKDFNMISDIVVTKKPEKYDIYYKCEDSRQGWVEALKQTIDSHWLKKKVIKLVIDISDIRPKGELINGFGGVASGPKPLAELLKFANNLINNRVTGKLSPVDCSDLINYVGRTVVAGNVRRTAILIFCDADNMEFINMKNYLIPEKLDIPEEREKLTEDQIAYLEVMREFQVSHRWSANISVVIDENFKDYDQFIDSLATNGEPGLVNLDLARKYGRLVDIDKYIDKLADPDVEGFNACGEISLASGEPCNVVEIFPYICNKLNIDINLALDLATKYAKRVTFAKYDWEITKKIIEKNRRIGASLSGIQDWVMNYFDNYNDLKNTLDEMYNIVEKSDIEYSKLLNCNPSIKLTTVKPSGCWKSNSLISTENGIYRFNELVSENTEGWQEIENINVQTRYDNKKILKGFNNGVVDTKKIITQDGFELEISLNHPLLISDNNRLEWKKANELKVGDKLIAKLDQYNKLEESVLIPLYVNKNSITNGLKTPDKMSPELAWFLGLFWGDGSVHEKGIRISFNRKESGLVNWINDYIENTFGIKPIVDNDHSIYINSVHLLEWLKMNNLLKNYSTDLIMPFAIRTASKESIKSFITGVWRADGGTHNLSNWTICTVSKQFAQELGVLCRAVGFNIKMKLAGPGEWGSQDRWIILNRNMDKENNRYRSKEFRNRLINDNLWTDSIVSIEDSKSLTLDVEIEELHEYIAQGFVSHNTVSLLPGVSPGMHWHYAPYYIRRIRFSDNDNLLNVLKKCGYYMEEDLVSPNTMVVEFPVKVDLAEHLNFKSAMDVTIENQFEFQSLLQEWWSDNSVSCTISFKPEEKHKIAKLINDYKNKLKSTSLLPYSDHNYKQIPYQPITKEEYEYRKSLIKHRPEDIMKIDDSESTELIDSMECSSGHCPIK